MLRVGVMDDGWYESSAIRGQHAQDAGAIGLLGDVAGDSPQDSVAIQPRAGERLGCFSESVQAVSLALHPLVAGLESLPHPVERLSEVPKLLGPRPRADAC